MHERIGAVNNVGGWLAAHLERMLKRPAGEHEWFFEEKEIVKFMDAGLVGSILVGPYAVSVSCLVAQSVPVCTLCSILLFDLIWRPRFSST
jgi:hypothetical protein